MPLNTFLLLVKVNNELQGINVFQCIYRYMSYGNTTTYFLKDTELIKESKSIFCSFSQYLLLHSIFLKIVSFQEYEP